jgi:hypothetical protein
MSAGALAAKAKKSGTAGCAMPGVWVCGWWLGGGSSALLTAWACAVAFAVALLLSGAFAGAVARALSGTAAVAAAFAFVHESLAVAWIAAGAARLAATAGAGSLREREPCGDQQAGDEDEDGFRFHGVSWFCSLSRERNRPSLHWMKRLVHEQEARGWMTGLSFFGSKAGKKTKSWARRFFAPTDWCSMAYFGYSRQYPA